MVISLGASMALVGVSVTLWGKSGTDKQTHSGVCRVASATKNLLTGLPESVLNVMGPCVVVFNLILHIIYVGCASSRQCNLF